MSTNPSNSKGIGHAPGVLCLIAGIPEAGGDVAAVNNGKVVTLLHLLRPGITAQCACGNIGEVPSYLRLLLGPFWQVVGEGLHCEKVGNVGTTSPVPQRYLIPLGDRSLLNDELIRDLEEQMQKNMLTKARIVIGNGRILTANDLVIYPGSKVPYKVTRRSN